MATPNSVMKYWFGGITVGALLVLAMAFGDQLLMVLWHQTADVNPHVVRLCAFVIAGAWAMLLLVFWLAERVT